MSRRDEFYIQKLEWLGPVLVRGLRLLSSVEALEQTFSFSQVMVLAALLQQRELKMTGLANSLGLSKANATGLVDRLVKRGMVVRHRPEEDRRVVYVSLTPEGRNAARRLVAQQRQGLLAMMKRIPGKDLALFIDTLERVALGLVESESSAGRSRRR